MKTLLAGLFVLGALVFVVAPSGVGASTGYSPAGLVRHSGGTQAQRAATSATTSGAFTCGAISCAAFEDGVNGYFQDVGAASGAADNVYSVDTQYSDNTGPIAYSETLGGTYEDTNPFPANGCSSLHASKCLTEAQLVAEISSDVSSKGWTENGSNLFVILLPDGVDTCFSTGPSAQCASNTFCAYHDNSSSLIFAVEPFQAEWSCNGQNNGEGFPNGQTVDETVNTLSHEQNEAITHPYPEIAGGWYTDSNGGDEIGDLCAWGFGTALGTANGQPYNQVINGHDYSVQQEYSNAANNNNGGCVQHLGGTATGITDNGSGPLTYHGGSVMRTNNVYTIYWIPATAADPPALSISPVVTGTPAVGQTLSTDNGTWTNSPTGYAYKWQRCSALCVPILNATSSQYTVVAADAGYQIRSEVLASNDGGPAVAGYAPSGLTAVVPAGGKPKVSTLPRVSGAAVVGNSLSVSNGTWSHSPVSYGYQWLRCSSLGTSCKAIVGATLAQYVLTSSDIGHKLAAKVTATNGFGSVTASSANKSGKVKS